VSSDYSADGVKMVHYMGLSDGMNYCTLFAT